MQPRPLAFGIAAFAALMMGGTALADGMSIAGDISYRERIALPDTAVATVALIDVSLADAPSVTISQQVIDPAGQVPIPFVLPFEPDAILAGHSYALSARIEVDGQLWFINDTRISVDPLVDVGMVAIPLVSARGAGDEQEGAEQADEEDSVDVAEPGPLAGTRWVLKALDGAAIHADVETTLIFSADEDSINGNGGCNSYGGSVSYDADDAIAISQVFSTLMACDEQSMTQERAYFDSLEAVGSYSIQGDALLLFNEDSVEIARFSAQTDTDEDASE